MTKTLFLAIALISASGAANAATPYIHGVGATDCQDAMETLAAHPSAASYVYSEWINGIMSGLNFVEMAEKKPFHDLRGVTNDAVIQAVKGYCAAHPDGALSDAAVQIWIGRPKVTS